MSVLFLVLLTVTLSSGDCKDVTIEATRLFQNTLNRWGIRTLNDADRSQRWRRFLSAKTTVDEHTDGVLLDSLNRFSVLNDAEYKARTRLYQMGLNFTDFQPKSSAPSPAHHHVSKRSLAASNDYWENTLGLHTPGDQAACGSCWSFPNTGAIEALYKKLTGEFAKFAEQYFVDCTFTYSGCAGGTTNDGYKITLLRQFMLYESFHRYTADYVPCAFTSDIESGTNNAMKKMWLQDWYPTSKTEEGVLAGLVYSPVAIGVYISNNIFAYSGGTWSDSLCATQATPHAMLLVGYTETTIRVKNSYGTDWGDYGYMTSKRDGNLQSCRYWDHAYYISATQRRDMEYDWCFNSKLATKGECQTSCKEMGDGWDLAVIPTKRHNQEVVEKIDAVYPGVKSDDKYNLLWIGIQDPTKTFTLSWVDEVTPVNYVNMSSDATVGKFGMINKNTGQWVFKNSLTYKARGMCSRAINCWDISSAVQNGGVTFDKADRSYGTIASVTCNSGYSLSGASTLTCSSGVWDQSLPTCTCTQEGGCSGQAPSQQCTTVTVENAQISGASQPASSGQTITVTCNTGYTLSGNSELTCDGTSFGTLPTCQIKQCAAVTVENAQITPSQPVNYGAKITVACNTGYTLSGNSELTCDGTSFGTLPTCQIKQCSAITLENGSITPTQPVNHGVTITVTCNNGYVISGDSELLCQGTTFNTATPTCTLPQCPVITVDNAEITGDTQPAKTGQVITVTCYEGFNLAGSSTLTCTGTSFDNDTPTCNTCNELKVLNAILTPDEETSTVQVACINNGYELVGESSLSCEMCLDNYKTDTIMCKGPTFAEGAVPECRLRPGSCPGGTHYTTDGCETCPTGHWMTGGDNSGSGSNGCNKCPGVKTSSEGSTSAGDCHYTICTCKMVQSAAAGGKYKTFCSCL